LSPTRCTRRRMTVFLTSRRNRRERRRPVVSWSLEKRRGPQRTGRTRTSIPGVSTMKAVLIGACLLTLASIVARPAEAEEADDPANEKLKVGDEAPDFAFPDPENPDKTVKLSELKGKKNVVLAFYPKAFTGGCTKQLCGYRDDFSKFEAADTMVVAVSADDQDESTRFKKEHKMPFS